MSPEVFLASSALIDENFDGVRTIEEGVRGQFDGVQLFLDERYRDAGYRNTVIDDLQESGLGLVVHLPNKVDSELDVKAAESLVEAFPDARFLIHYLPATELPDIVGTKVGWENSVTGTFDKDHIAAVKAQVETDKTFFVFDFGRLLYSEDNSTPEEILTFIRTEIQALNPQKDFIHMSDKTSWTLRFRDCMCTFGDGVCRDLVSDIRAFKGMVVLEHENLQMAVSSLQVIKRQ